jgi:hypothetical protein
MGGEQGFTGENPLAGGKQLAHDALARVGAVTHPGVESDVLLHVGHGACLCNHGLARIERYLYQLHLCADDFVLDLVAVHFAASCSGEARRVLLTRTGG